MKAMKAMKAAKGVKGGKAMRATAAYKSVAESTWYKVKDVFEIMEPSGGRGSRC